MPTKAEKAAAKAVKDQEKAAKAQAKVDAKAAKDKEKADAKAAKAAAKAGKSVDEVSAPVEAAPVAGVPAFNQNVSYEGVKVVEILSSKHTPTHFHCRMSNGVTCHVPKSLFE